MESADNWRSTLETFRRTATRRGREGGGYFSIEGIRLHERALRAGVSLERVVVTSRFCVEADARSQLLLEELRRSGCLLEIIPEAAMEKLVGGRDLGHIMGLIKLPPQRELSGLINDRARRRPLVLVAVDVKDPGNVGALIRTAHAGKATAFIATGVSDPYHPKALRTTMGSLFKLPVFYRAEAVTLIKELRALGIEPIATVARGGTPLPEAEFAEGGTAVLIGNEAYGLAAAVLAEVSKRVTIPMEQDVDSFSVNAAAAVLLYEIVSRGN